jgi:hypothetical protein
MWGAAVALKVLLQQVLEVGMLPGLVRLLLGLLLEPHWAPWVQVLQLVCQQLGLLPASGQQPW